MTDRVDFSAFAEGLGTSSPVVVVHGEVDMATAPELESCLSVVLPTAEAQLILDLTDCTYFDSTGLSVLVRTLRQLPESCPLVVRRPQPNIVRVLEITQLDTVVTIDHS